MMGDRGFARWLCVTIVAAIASVTPASAGPAENSALLDAAFRLDLEAVKEALASGANPNSQSALVVGHKLVTPIKAVTMGGWGLERDVAEQRALSIATLLFAHGAIIGSDDFGVLSHPVTRGEWKFVTLLLEKGASPILRTDGYTPTELAVKYDKRAIYDLLIANGGKAVSERDAAQIALVHAVAVDDHLRMRKAVKDGASIDAPDVSGTTALLSALSIPVYVADHAASVEWAIKNGADVNRWGKASGSGETNEMPLHLFVSRNRHSMNGGDEDARRHAERTMRLILETGAKVSGMDTNGMTPLHEAAKADNLKAAEILIEAGSKISPRDKLGKQPLDYAESAAMIKLLKDYGAKE